MNKEQRLKQSYPSVYQIISEFEREVASASIDAAFADDEKENNAAAERRLRASERAASALFDLLSRLDASPEVAVKKPDATYASLLRQVSESESESESKGTWEVFLDGHARREIQLGGSSFSINSFFGFVPDKESGRAKLVSSWYPWEDGTLIDRHPELNSGLSFLIDAIQLRCEDAPSGAEVFDDLAKILKHYVPSANDLWDTLGPENTVVSTLVRYGSPFFEQGDVRVVVWANPLSGEEGESPYIAVIDPNHEDMAYAMREVVPALSRMMLEEDRQKLLLDRIQPS